MPSRQADCKHQAIVVDYSVEHFRNIPQPQASWVAFESAKIERILSEDIAKIFQKYQVEGHFDITLLHKHDNLEDNQRLVIVGRVMTPWSTTLMDVVKNEPSLGKIIPQAFFVKDGKFYPYEFIHLEPEELASLPQHGEDRLGMFRDFLQEFAEIVEGKQIHEVIGLRLLTNKERAQRSGNPKIKEYEINDEGGAMITLSSAHDLDVAEEYVSVGWGFTKGVLHVKKSCYYGTNHSRPR